MWIRHIVMTIEWVEKDINSYKNEIGKNRRCMELFGISYKFYKESINEYKLKWYKYIPSAWCNNVWKDWNCNCI